MLAASGISSGYGSTQILREVFLKVEDGATVALVGPNGAGKTTLLRALSGILRCWNGEITLDHQDITKLDSAKKARLGLLHVHQERQVFNELSVLENLLLGCYPKYRQLGPKGRLRLLEFVYSLFPRLHDRRGQVAGTLSGGEQQMLAIGRALMGEPKLLLLDEPSLGLAPMVVDTIYDVLGKLGAEKLAILLVEQDVHRALGLARYGYVLSSGRVVLEGPSEQLLASPEVEIVFLGTSLTSPV